jgi:hypothetical protein
MLNYIDAHTGADGVVQLNLPLELADQDIRFYLPTSNDQAPLEIRMAKRNQRAELLQMLRETQGAITDPTFVRQPQLNLGPPPDFDE